MKHYTPRMIIEAGIAESDRVEKLAPQVAANLCTHLRSVFKEPDDFRMWFDRFAIRISDYLRDKFQEWNDVLPDERQKEACFSALRFMHAVRNNDYFDRNPEYGMSQRMDRVRTAIYVVVMFIPGRHSGIEMYGCSSLDRYIVAAFGGTAAMCGKYGFGTRIFDVTPEQMRKYIPEVLGEET